MALHDIIFVTTASTLIPKVCVAPPGNKSEHTMPAVKLVNQNYLKRFRLDPAMRIMFRGA